MSKNNKATGKKPTPFPSLRDRTVFLVVKLSRSRKTMEVVLHFVGKFFHGRKRESAAVVGI